MKKGIPDGGIYGFSQPTAINQFRDTTNRQATMTGVTTPSFRCCTCGLNKPVLGRRRVTPGTNRDGFQCADCAPPDVVAPKPEPKVRAPAKPKKASKPMAVLMTDEQVLECREAYEFEGVTRRVLELKYNVTTDYMSKLLDYTVRSKLIPQRHRVSPHK